jgi:hypothetical protein
VGGTAPYPYMSVRDQPRPVVESPNAFNIKNIGDSLHGRHYKKHRAPFRLYFKLSISIHKSNYVLNILLAGDAQRRSLQRAPLQK